MALAAGALHVAMTLLDTVRPRYFVPRDGSLEVAMKDTRMRFGGSAAPSMWRVWRGVHLTHGLGIVAFGLLCLLIAVQDFGLVERVDAIRPLAIGVSAAYMAISIRFFFYGPVVVTAIATACFSVAAMLSA